MEPTAPATVCSMCADNGARLRASAATYSASEPLRAQSVIPKTGQSCCPVAQLGDESRDFVPWDTEGPIVPCAVSPGWSPPMPADAVGMARAPAPRAELEA
jgi:hypothetical protein